MPVAAGSVKLGSTMFPWKYLPAGKYVPGNSNWIFLIIVGNPEKIRVAILKNNEKM
jgi:hypothetical protein